MKKVISVLLALAIVFACVATAFASNDNSSVLSFDKNGELHVIISTAELPYSCPLITEKMKLNDDFIQATYTVWKHLVRDRLIFDLVQMDSKDKRRNHVPITIIK